MLLKIESANTKTTRVLDSVRYCSTSGNLLFFFFREQLRALQRGHQQVELILSYDNNWHHNQIPHLVLQSSDVKFI